MYGLKVISLRFNSISRKFTILLGGPSKDILSCSSLNILIMSFLILSISGPVPETIAKKSSLYNQNASILCAKLDFILLSMYSPTRSLDSAPSRQP